MRNRICVIIVIILLLFVVNVPLIQRFSITDGKTGHIVFQDKIENYRQFHVRFTHSVNRTPVNEYYRISGNEFILEKASFYSYGAGMPEAGEYGSGKPSVVDGLVHMDNINKKFKKFTYFAGTYANHSLNTDGKQVLFSQFVKPQTPVTFEIRKLSIVELVGFYLVKGA